MVPDMLSVSVPLVCTAMVAAKEVTLCACWAAAWTAFAALSDEAGELAGPDWVPPDGVDDAAWFELVQPATVSAAAATAVAA
jgi:hypothetical protein